MKEDTFECEACMDDLIPTNTCIYKYGEGKESQWVKSPYCEDCVMDILNTKWDRWVHVFLTTKCLKTLARMLEEGPPTWFSDPAFPVPEGKHVSYFVRGSDHYQITARYRGSPMDPDEFQAAWDKIKAARENPPQ